MKALRSFKGLHATTHRQTGMVLVVALVFLVVITVVGVASMQATKTEYRMSINNNLRDRSFQSAESARAALSEMMDEHVYERGWPAHIGVPSGFTVLDKDSDGSADKLYLDNGGSEDLMNHGSLTKDAQYRIDGNSDGDYLDGGDINAEVIVYRTEVVPAPGSGMAMVAGYEGLGKAAAAGGVHMHFELRGEGSAITDAKSRVDTEFRAVVRN